MSAYFTHTKPQFCEIYICVLVPVVDREVADFEFCFIVTFWIVLDARGCDISSACFKRTRNVPSASRAVWNRQPV